MDLNELRKLVRLMERAELTELEIDDSSQGLRVHLKRSTGGGGEAGGASPVVQQVSAGPGHAPAPLGASPAAAPAAEAEGEPALPPGTVVFASPMVGTFYRASSPESDPFVDVGSRAQEDTVLCIIEAMKVMNEIKAEMRGEIVAILVENGEAIEFGQPLFHVKQG